MAKKNTPMRRRDLRQSDFYRNQKSKQTVPDRIEESNQRLLSRTGVAQGFRKLQEQDRKKRRKRAKNLQRLSKVGKVVAKAVGAKEAADIFQDADEYGKLQRKKEEERKKRWQKVRRAAKVGQIGARIAGRKDIADVLGDVGSVASAGSRAERAQAGTLARQTASHYAGKRAEGLAAKKYNLPGGRAAALGGALSGLLKGGGLKDVAGEAFSWWMASLAFGAMFTLAGFIPALIYVDLHWTLNKLGFKFFTPFVGWHRVFFIIANLLAVMILLFVLTILVAVPTYISSQCDQGGFQGFVVRGVSKAASFFTGNDICDSVSGFGPISQALSSGVPTPPTDLFCPNVKPPPRVTVDCIECVDMRTLGIPIKPTNTNSNANVEVAGKLQRMLAPEPNGFGNNTFQVTEAFCPVPNPRRPDRPPHSSPNHYNGFAVDINVRNSSDRIPEKVAELYLDAQRAGFSRVLCEYPVGFLDEFGISCRASIDSTGVHIHLEN